MNPKYKYCKFYFALKLYPIYADFAVRMQTLILLYKRLYAIVCIMDMEKYVIFYLICL